MNPTPQQTTILEATAETIVVVAGPGSGKTTTLVERCRRHPDPNAVVITFTNAAADHLRQKLEVNGTATRPAFIGTLHAFALHILRGYRPNITLLDEDEAKKLIVESLANIRSKATASRLQTLLNTAAPATQAEKIALMHYRSQLRSMDAEDYDTLLLSFLEHIIDHGLRVSTLMVDEFQDSGTVDARIYAAITAQFRFYVGDPDQSIYSFRGGRLENLLDVAEAPGTFTTFLEDNFRCGAHICRAANRLIAHNRNRIEKETKSAVKTTGTVTVAGFTTELTEALAIADWADRTEPHETTAILVRYNHEKERIISTLEGTGKRIHRPEPDTLPPDFRFALAALALAANPTNRFAARTFTRELWGPAELNRRLAAEAATGVPMQPFNSVTTNLRDFAEGLNLSRDMRQMLFDASPLVDSGWKTHAQEMILRLREQAKEAAPPPSTGILVMTLHGAKGLEFDRVWIPGVTAAAFPEKSEEARRLLFVGITRARRELVLTSADEVHNPYAHRLEKALPSPFLQELNRA